MKVLTSVFILFNQIFQTEMFTITEKPAVVRKKVFNKLRVQETHA